MKSGRLRFAVRAIILVAAVAVAWPRTGSSALAVLLPALSPYVALSSLLAARTFSVLLLLAIPALVLSIWSAKWFCRWACPTGFVQELLEKLRPASNRWLRWPRLGPWVALVTLGGAALGFPLLLWLDPLAIFHGFVNAWRVPLALATLATGCLLPLVLLLTLLSPKLWCQRLCPLGSLQELVMRRTKVRVVPGRRAFVAAGAGAVGAFFVRRGSGATVRVPLRPPGALDEARFSGVCVRCGNCAAVCPSRIIQPDLGGHGVASLLTPVVKFDVDYCREDCHRCTQVCPSGAIARVTLAEKNRSVIGPARVDLETCVMANGEECTVCIASCPYTAVTIRTGNDGFSTQPGVDLTKCTGCGACEALCPVRPRAIRVVASSRQRL